MGSFLEFWKRGLGKVEGGRGKGKIVGYQENGGGSAYI